VAADRSRLSTQDVARQSGISKDTLLRWLRSGLVPEPSRDGRGWRSFSPAEAAGVVAFAERHRGVAPGDGPEPYLDTGYGDALVWLEHVDWSFTEAKTDYLTHGCHPYPAKFIPQIPNTLIQALSAPGETICDPFCGSGTTLVEAMLLGRNAIGVDASPLACLISRAKTTPLDEPRLNAVRAMTERASHAVKLYHEGQSDLFGTQLPPYELPQFKGLDFWFDIGVAHELAILKYYLDRVESGEARAFAHMVFSSIIVQVSWQDSDTRYVRRRKHIERGDVIRKFSQRLAECNDAVTHFGNQVPSGVKCEVVHASALDCPLLPLSPVHLVVCSPPYPNAWSYHLYHRTRMLWLGMDQETFKANEIGSHRKYSKPVNGATEETFGAELRAILSWLYPYLASRRYAVFVIGDSIIGGKTVRNNEVLARAAESCEYRVVADIERHIHAGRKSFNPSVGKIEREHIVLLRKTT